MSTTFQDSRKNTLKRDPISGSALLGPPKTSAFSGSLFVTNLVVSHNLGYPPVYRYYYEPYGDGVVWPRLASRDQGSALNPNNVAQLGPGVVAWLDTTAPYDLHIQLFYTANTLTNNYQVYWEIYKDFRLI